MSNTIITGESLPDIPWEEKTEDNNDPVWRYRDNTIITRKAVTDAYSIFNSAVVPFKDGYAGVFRVDDRSKFLILM